MATQACGESLRGWCVRRRCSPSGVEGGMEGARSDLQAASRKSSVGRQRLRPAAEREAPVTGSSGEQRVSPYFHSSSFTLLFLFLPLPLLSPPLTHQRAFLRNPTVPAVSLRSPDRPGARNDTYCLLHPHTLGVHTLPVLVPSQVTLGLT